MKDMTVKEAILATINSRQGVIGVELVLNVMSLTSVVAFDEAEYFKQLAELKDEFVELEYILPQLSYRIKSIYFPKGTKIVLDMEQYDQSKSKVRNNDSPTSI